MASTRGTSCASACARRSVDVSTRIVRTARATGDSAALSWPPSADSSIRIDGRVRRSLGSVERQTRQSQPIIGTPCDVPVPSSVTLRLNNPLSAAGRLDVAQAQLVEHLLEDLPLFGAEVAAGLLLEQRQDVDHLLRAFEVRLRRTLAGLRIRDVAEVD